MSTVTDLTSRLGIAQAWPPERRQALAGAVARAQGWLLRHQNPRGYWVGELEADASVSAGYISVMYFMYGAVDPVRQRKAVNYVLSRQNTDGSWSAYYGGPGDISVSVQVYLALKLAGLPAGHPRMVEAREFILDAGGIGKVNVITRVWLALFGQFDWRGTPSVPPELLLLPDRFPLNLYDFASWSRETIAALALVSTLKPVCRPPEGRDILELYREPEGKRRYPHKAKGLLTWRRFFLAMDSLLKLYDHLPVKPGRRRALQQTVRWILDHQEADGSWGGIMLPWVYSLMGLKAMGYPLSHPAMVRGLEGLEGFIIEDEDTLRLQPAVSPVWDTAWSTLALRESGLPGGHPALRRAATWLLDQEVRIAGDWQVKNPNTPPGGWAFEFENDFYPDLDDTPVVARALRRVRLPSEGEVSKAAAIKRALRWVLDMQSRDGGWAAFDRDNDKGILNQIPFADFMSPLDPTCADVTAHVVEFLNEVDPGNPALQRALTYLRNTQEPDGAWYGRWGVNYIYGTGLTLAALGAVGERLDRIYLRRAALWLIACQNPDGGWGESCGTYESRNLRGCGPSTPSQTAWALMGLIGAGAAGSDAARRGVHYLLREQRPDGSWREDQYTGTGFPKAFYLKYELYPIYFPLLALARYQAYLAEATS